MDSQELDAISLFSRKFPSALIKKTSDDHLEVEGLDLDRVDGKWVVSQITAYHDQDTGWETDHEDLSTQDSLLKAIGFAIQESVKLKIYEVEADFKDNVAYAQETVEHIHST